MDQRAPFPGPEALGRGIVVLPGDHVPAGCEGWPRLRIDATVLAAPAEAVAWLDAAWRARQPTVVELAVPFADVKQPETDDRPPYLLDPSFELARERLHFLVWANRYDGRASDAPPRWHHAARALRLGATAAPATGNGRHGHGDAAPVDPGDAGEAAAAGDAAPVDPGDAGKAAAAGDAGAAPVDPGDAGDVGDVVLPDGTPVWIDGGPRTATLGGALRVVHVNQLWAEQLRPDRWAPPSDELADDQMAAVTHPGGAARVLAPAGSGKTRVLTARLRHLLSDRGWAPETVTALAYNTRAAEEMRSRTRDLPHAQIRTLHALGFELLGRANGGRPRVLDERTVRGLLEGLAPVKPRANDDVYAPYLEALAEVRGGLQPPDDVEAVRDDVPGFGQLFAAYRARLHELGAIDFDEQVYGAIEVLLRNPELRQWAQRRCAHLLVDELQDLTPAQLLMIRLLAAPAYDVYGVGDDDQVIYGYAGADPRFLVDYDRFFPGAASFLLEVNYRCPPPVVHAASTLLSYNALRVPKAIRAGRSDGEPPGLAVERHDDAALGGRLVELVQAALAGGAAPAEIAVLTRVNAGLLAPQVLLGEARVPVQRVVGERMLDRTGTRAALAWLRLADAAGSGDGPGEASGHGGRWSDAGQLHGPDLAVVARRPSRGLRPGLLRALGNGEWALSRLGSFARGLDDARSRNALVGLYDDLVMLGRLVRKRASVADLLVTVRDQVGLAGALGRLDDARSAPGGGHVDDLDALVMVARAYGAGAPTGVAGFEPWLRRRLRDRGSPAGGDGHDGSRHRHDGITTGDGIGPGDRIAAGQGGSRDGITTGDGIGTGDDRGSEGDGSGGAGGAHRSGGVTLSTVHRVKGLEWPHVVVWDASDGVMPHRLNQVGRLLEEERRVFHVAITRARASAVVLARQGAPSPFLDELTGEAPRRPASAAAETATATGATRPRDRAAGTGAGGRARGTAAAGAPLSPEESKRSDALREWRRRRAKDDGVPAYVVLNDRHLDGIARRAPETLDELAACDGIGPTKLDRYGDEILAVLQDV